MRRSSPRSVRQLAQAPPPPPPDPAAALSAACAAAAQLYRIQNVRRHILQDRYSGGGLVLGRCDRQGQLSEFRDTPGDTGFYANPVLPHRHRPPAWDMEKRRSLLPRTGAE